MKLKLIAGLMVAAAMVSCAGNGKTADGGVNNEDASRSVADVNIIGQWYIENYYCPLNFIEQHKN